MNENRTCTDADTPLTQWRSPAVRTIALLGYTYFIRVGKSIKIGSASNFERRLKGLQTAHAKPIDVLAVVPATVADEYSVHQLFAKLRTRGEWFRASRELLDFIDKVKAEAGSQGADLGSALRDATIKAPAPPSAFGLARRHLYDLRKSRRHGEPIVYCCNNMIEMMDNYEKSAADAQRANLRKSLEKASVWLKQLKAV